LSAPLPLNMVDTASSKPSLFTAHSLSNYRSLFFDIPPGCCPLLRSVIAIVRDFWDPLPFAMTICHAVLVGLARRDVYDCAKGPTCHPGEIWIEFSIWPDPVHRLLHCTCTIIFSILASKHRSRSFCLFLLFLVFLLFLLLLVSCSFLIASCSGDIKYHFDSSSFSSHVSTQFRNIVHMLYVEMWMCTGQYSMEISRRSILSTKCSVDRRLSLSLSVPFEAHWLICSLILFLECRVCLSIGSSWFGRLSVSSLLLAIWLSHEWGQYYRFWTAFLIWISKVSL
jgi:hypothetical protein